MCIYIHEMWNVRDVKHGINGMTLLFLFIICMALKECLWGDLRLFKSDKVFSLFNSEKKVFMF